MANYSYAGLSVRVAADTRALTAGVAKASEEAGAEAGKTLGSHITKGIGSATKTVGKSLSSVVTLAGAGAAGLLVESVKAGVAYNKVYDQGMRAFKAVLGTDKAAASLMGTISKLAETSPFPKAALIAATQQMLAFGFKASQVQPTLTAIQDAVAATGKGAAGMSAVTAALGRVQQTGKFTTRTLTALSGQGIDAMGLLAKGMGESVAQVQADIKSKTFDSQKALTILTQQMEIKYKGAAAGLSNTWEGTKNRIEEVMAQVGSAIVQPFIGKDGGGLVIQWGQKFADLLDTLAPLLTPLTTALMQSLAPAIATVNKGLDTMIGYAEKLADPKHLPAATNAVQKYGAAGLALGAAGTTLAGVKLFEELPIVGPLLEGIVGPFEKVTESVAGLGKAMTAKLFPALGEMLGFGGEAAEGGIAALSGPILALIAAVGLVIAASPKLRSALVGFGKAVVGAFGPVVSALIGGFKLLLPYVMQVAKMLGDDLAPIFTRLTPLLKPIGQIVGVVLVLAFKEIGLELKILMPVLSWAFGLLADLIGWLTDPLIWLASVLVVVAAGVTWFGAHVTQIWNAVAGAVSGAWRVVASVTSAVWGGIVTTLRIAWAVIETIVTVYVILVRAIILAAWLLIETVTKAVWGVIGPYVTAVWRAIAAAARVVWAAISAPVVAAWRAIMAVTTIALSWLKGALSSVWSWAVSTTRVMWAAIAAPVVAFWGVIKGPLTTALNWVKGSLSSVWSWAVSATRAMWAAIAAPLVAFWDVIRGPLTTALDWVKGAFSGVWSTIVKAAGSVGGDVLRALKAGFAAAWKNVSAWVQKEVVDPIVDAVKKFFGIKPSGGGSTGAAAAKSVGPATRAAGAQGGGGVAAAAAGSSGGGVWGDAGELLQTLVHNLVEANPLDVAEHIFGSVADALGWIVVKGLVAVEALGKTALSALEHIPGVQSLLSWLGGAASATWGFIKGLVSSGTPGVAGLVGRALGFAGHRYVWGGAADSAGGFDCSSFVNMLAGMQGLPIPGNFLAPSAAHGPVTTNWLTFGAMSKVPYDSMLPGDLYVNRTHMGIVTGHGTGFAARSTSSGTGPQAVPRGLYTILRFPGGGGGGGTGTASLLAQALAGLLSQGQGLEPVAAGSSMANLLTVAGYMARNGWSLSGAAGVAGNVYRESLGDPLSYGSGGRGLIGWTPPSALPNSAFVPGNPSLSLSRQLPLVNSFFRADMGSWVKVANAQADAGLAALIVMNMGEKPAGSSQTNPFYGGTGTSGGAQRAAMARTILDKLRKSASVKMATGGIISEPVAGIGASGRSYLIGEAGPERVSPLLPGGATPAEAAMLAELRSSRRPPTVINVYPRASQSETAIAAAVSRELGWAAAGGSA